MSSALAIAGVTHVLRDLLNDGIVDQDVAAAVGAAISVRALPPDRVQTVATDATPVLNVFLHRVARNTGWANYQLPVRTPRGGPANRPLLALDLHYLISAFGFDDLHAEILLGYAMRILHENPVLTRAQITRALSPAPAIGGTLPPALEALDRAGLADQIEEVKITATYLSTEEMTRIWSSLQTQYRPTTSYEVTTVLIEAETPSVTPRPVLTIGPDNRGVAVTPSLVPALPAITGAVLPAGQPSVRLGESFTIEGRHLDGTTVEARIEHARLEAPLVLAPDPGATARSVRFTIPDDAASAVAWAAGPALIRLAVQRASEPAPRLTNAWPLMIAPIADFAGAVVGGGPGAVTVTLPLRPEIRAGQEVALILGSDTAIAPPLATPDATASEASFTFGPIASGSYPAWLRVDGTDSWFILRDLPPQAPDFLPRAPELDPASSLSVPV